jgi:hypothetical protein
VPHLWVFRTGFCLSLLSKSVSTIWDVIANIIGPRNK